MSFSPSQLATLIGNGAGATTDFLPDTSSITALAESIAAFANHEGGVLIVGVTRNGIVTGLDDPDDMLKQVYQALLIIDPLLADSPTPEIVEYEGHSLVALRVKAADERLHAVGGRFVQRAGTSNEAMSTARLQHLLVTRRELPFERRVPDGAEQRDLSRSAIEEYLETLPDFDFSGASATTRMADILRRKGVLRAQDGKPTYAGLLLFGREPQQWLPSAQILFAFYLGTEMGDTFQRQQIDGTLPQQIAKAESFLLSNMRRGVIMEGLKRVERLEYPRAAVREAIVNAVAHRDYSIRGAEIQIFMFSDRIEFHSPGRLPGHVTVDNILHERFSRNETMVQVLSDLGFIERLGYGIDRILRLANEYGLATPTLTETANGFKLTLLGPGEAMIQTPTTTTPAAPVPTPVVDDIPDLAQWHTIGLNPRQIDALLFVQRDGRITNRDFQELAPDVSAETLRRDLSDLVERGLLLKIGEKKATYYILK